METPEKKLDLVDYLTCPDCQGLGKINGKNCASCLGLGLAMKLEDMVLYWDRKIDRNTIFENKVRRGAKLAVNFILFFIGGAGIIALSWQVWRYFGSELFLSWKFVVDFFRQRNDLMRLFWFSLFADLYLYYRFSRDEERLKKIKEKEYKLKDRNDHPLQIINSWAEFKKLDREKKVEVSDAYGEEAMSAVEEAYRLADKIGHGQLLPIHLLASLLPFEKIRIIMARLGIAPDILKEKITQALSRQLPGKKIEMSLVLRQALIESYHHAYESKKSQVDVIDLFLAVVQLDEQVKNIIYDLEADINKVKNVAVWISFQDILRQQRKRFKSSARLKPKGDIDRAMTAIATPTLNSFSQNLTRLAKNGYFGSVLGRDKEVEEIFRVMESGGLRNAILVGAPGVGKSAIISSVAQKMVAEEVPEILQDKRLMSLNASNLVGGATPEQAQARFLQVIGEIEHAGNIVLVIENISALGGVTAGGEQSVDLLGILAEALGRGAFFCLSTATPNDYSKYVEKNSAIKSVFQKVGIKEVEKNGAIQILETKAGAIEYKNQVYFSYQALEKAVDLSIRFIHDQYLPEKAINIIEESAVLVRKKKGKKSIITGEDVAKVVSQIANVPATQVTAEEKEKLLHLEDRIHQRLIGQDDAVKMVAAALRRARAELRSVKRPIANLMFLGPTGVGKTELAKTIAEVYFGHEKNMIRLDMSEYQGASSLPRLIGSAGLGGYLTEAVRKKPFALLLLDEIEKADQNILNLFLQVMEDGQMTDNNGNKIDFTNTIIIATSNAGTQFIQEQVKAGMAVKEITQQLIDVQLKSHFRPEFLNRFDGVIVFRPLNMDEVKQIAKLMLNKVAVDLEKKGVGLEVTNEAVTELSEAGFDPTLGARPLRRVIQERVRDVLANLILENKLQRRDTVVFNVGGKVSVKKARK